jgi:hypothetical protein
MKELITETQPLWYVIAMGAGAAMLKLSNSLGIGDLLKRKVDADHDCKEKVAKLEITVIKLHTSFTLIVAYLNNPENIEATKANLKTALDDLDQIIDVINNKNAPLK